jgi:hypothetical protein
MRLSTSLVAVKRITSTMPRSTFSDEKLEHSAKLILDIEGIINPIILRRAGLDSYEVVEGDFEYHAAARAREIDPRKGEMISAFIIEEDKEKAIAEQIKLLRKSKFVVDRENPVIDSGDFGNRLTNLESYLGKQIQDIKNAQEEYSKWLEAKLKEFEDKIPSKKKPLDIFNDTKLTELLQMLINAGLPESKATKIAESVDRERNSERFSSLSDVVDRVKITQGKKKIREIRGISSETMVKIINNWSNILFV